MLFQSFLLHLREPFPVRSLVAAPDIAVAIIPTGVGASMQEITSIAAGYLQWRSRYFKVKLCHWLLTAAIIAAPRNRTDSGERSD